MAFLPQLRESLRYGMSLGSLGAGDFLPSVMGDDLQFDARSRPLVATFGAFAGCLQVEEVIAKHALGAAHLAHEGQNVTVAAEVLAELAFEGVCARFLAGTYGLSSSFENRYVGTVEAVDALLGIAHRA